MIYLLFLLLLVSISILIRDEIKQAPKKQKTGAKEYNDKLTSCISKDCPLLTKCKRANITSPKYGYFGGNSECSLYIPYNPTNKGLLC